MTQEGIHLVDWLRGPRIWRKDIRRPKSRIAPGTIVPVFDKNETLVCWGIWHPSSMIAVRVLRRGELEPTHEWLCGQATRAAQLRLDDPAIPNDICRILHGEGDDFPALIVDRYGDLLVAEAYSESALTLFDIIRKALHETLGTKHHRLTLGEKWAQAERTDPVAEDSMGAPRSLKITEHDLRYELDFNQSHKTGFFCDQRENRLLLRQAVESEAKRLGRPPRVLDVCCYSGGFSLNAAAGGAGEILAIDLDETILPQAKRNANLNQFKQIKFVQADAFSYLRTLGRNEKTYDIVILDPPKFINSRREWEEGQARYHDLNKLGIPLLEKGGLMLTCSCSGLFQGIDLQETIRRSARLRPLRLLRETGAGPDHPVSIDFPEGRYLKAFWLRAD
ncbi:MAG: class I SAM-dependent rRNA methyltransferase [Planctomycetes bacterium]|jgi:23S rRNA (cytosine1962-C5)-methyltransferase|nr:class I SAM-dependent rRNA methyltransferase [Planctomycetota bacterium]